jgi:hypothetical protein
LPLTANGRAQAIARIATIPKYRHIVGGRRAHTPGIGAAIMPATAPIAPASSQPNANIQPARMPTRRLDTGFCPPHASPDLEA